MGNSNIYNDKDYSDIMKQVREEASSEARNSIGDVLEAMLIMDEEAEYTDDSPEF